MYEIKLQLLFAAFELRYLYKNKKKNKLRVQNITTKNCINLKSTLNLQKKKNTYQIGLTHTVLNS